MSEQDVRDGLAALVVDEPPLNFDPDAFMARADADVRRRRTLVSAGGATLLVAAAAVVLPIALRGAPGDQVPSGGGSVIVTTAPKPDFVWPPAHHPIPQYSVAGIEAKAHALQQHARTVFPAVAPAVSGVHVDLFSGEAEGDYHAGQLTLNGALHFTARQGKAVVVVQVDAGATTPAPQAACEQDGDVDCTITKRADGSALLVTHLQQGKYKIDTVRHYRPDGVVVSVSGYNADMFSAQPTPYLSTIPVTDAQLTALATDRGFTL